MNALESLRAQGQYTFCCTLLRDGKSLDTLLGPRMDGNTVRVKAGAELMVAELGTVSVEGETLAQLEAEADRLLTRQIALKMLNRGARRDISGRFAGHSCEAAGRR